MAALRNNQLQDGGRRRAPDAVVYACIVDFNGDPVTPGQAAPVLRRTASGHLFIPPATAHSYNQVGFDGEDCGVHVLRRKRRFGDGTRG
ncbi:hypothetical protein BU23DRAFT_550140 [Bimuria novae-zelandiae CBS 107.79]|uniref:Uncharacterized protein n=1 Tax=Bimuria novae-zelandiae CBS 107.79 TaxID=1447943 RepID=A0A6A5VN66_9PLEO|nr:hypothetical protein BU23DRAFT_550140 [Bimuria novae-zelandiae CBS 107.79]